MKNVCNQEAKRGQAGLAHPDHFVCPQPCVSWRKVRGRHKIQPNRNTREAYVVARACDQSTQHREPLLVARQQVEARLDMRLGRYGPLTTLANVPSAWIRAKWLTAPPL